MTQFRLCHPAFPLALAVFVVSALLIWFAPIWQMGDRVRVDEQLFHWPAIEHFARSNSAQDYSSATTPGFHMLMGALRSVARLSLDELRTVGALITAGLVWAATLVWPRALPFRRVLLLSLPLATSIYMFPSGVWLVPDNLGWLTVLCVLLLSFKDRIGWTDVVFLALLGAAVVWVRQSNAWVVGVPALALLLRHQATPSDQRLPSWKLALQLLTIGLPATFSLAYFVFMWHGLTPPRFQGVHQSGNPVAPAWLMVQFAFYAVWFLPVLWPARRLSIAGRSRLWIALGAAFGLLAALAVPSSFNQMEGRHTGLWALVQWAPVVADRSLLVLLCAPLGGGLLGWLCGPLDTRRAVLVLVGAFAFGLAMATNKFAYDKYYAAYVLLLLPTIVRHWPREAFAVNLEWWRDAPLLALAALNVTVMYLKLFRL